MRNLSKQWCLESIPHAKDKIMKIILVIIVAVMTVFMSTANATEINITMPTKAEVTKMVIEANPIASPAEIDRCYAAVKSGGLHTIYSSKVSIYCTKSEITRVFAQ